MTARLWSEALEAADLLLEEVFRLPVAKALDPQDPKDFLVLSKRLADAVKGLTGPAEAKALRTALDLLDVDWATITDAQRDQVIAAARAAVVKPPPRLPEVVAAFEAAGTRTVKGAKASFKEQFGVRIGVDLTQTDQRVLAHAASSQALYIRDQYGRRADALAATARKVVASGLAQGLGRYELAKDLRDTLAAQGVARSDAYWQMAAGVFINRSRVLGSLSGYQDAGVTRFRFDAILDEVTTLQCRFMHGRVFEVSDALDRYSAVAASANPEDVKVLQPWMGVSRDAEGRPVLHYKDAAGVRQPVATVTQNALGQLDETGSYENALSEKDLAKAGLLTPPLHGNCRSTIRPVFDDVARPRGRIRTKPKPGAAAEPVVVPAPAPPPPAPAEPAPAPPLPVVMPAAKPASVLRPGDESLSMRRQGALALVDALQTADGLAFSAEFGTQAPTKEDSARIAELSADLDFVGLISRSKIQDPVRVAHIRVDDVMSAQDVAEAIRAYRPKGRGPVLARYADDRYMVIEGHADLAAALLSDRASGDGSPPKEIVAYVVDVRKAPKQAAPIPTEQVQERLRVAFESLAQDGGAAVREVIRGALAHEGVWSRDIAFMRPDAGKLRVEAMREGVGAYHNWDGAVAVPQRLVDGMRDYFGRAPFRNVWDADDRLARFGTLLHEELHGASPMTPNAYRGIGAFLEEAATEHLSRAVARRVLGLPENHDVLGVPQVTDTDYTFAMRPYELPVIRVIHALYAAAKVPAAEGLVRFERAVRRMRSIATRGTVYTTAPAYADGFCDALELEGDARKTFLAEIEKHLGDL